jgi:hypothetical protein
MLAPRIRSTAADAGIALAWVPFAAVAFWLRGEGHQLVWFLEALAAFSLVHQPLTLLLVYGDAEQFADCSSSAPSCLPPPSRSA